MQNIELVRQWFGGLNHDFLWLLPSSRLFGLRTFLLGVEYKETKKQCIHEPLSSDSV